MAEINPDKAPLFKTAILTEETRQQVPQLVTNNYGIVGVEYVKQQFNPTTDRVECVFRVWTGDGSNCHYLFESRLHLCYRRQ